MRNKIAAFCLAILFLVPMGVIAQEPAEWNPLYYGYLALQETAEQAAHRFRVYADGRIYAGAGASVPTKILQYASTGITHFKNLVFEGATEDAYETTFAIVDPTADNTYTFPAAGSGTVFVSSLATNAADIANSVWGSSNGITAEGATADAYETIIGFTDVGADVAATVPGGGDAAFSFVPSSLTTNDVDVANSAWFETASTIVLEGATADAYETRFVPVDPTADRAIAIGDAAATIGEFQYTWYSGYEFADSVDQIAFLATQAVTITDIDQIHVTAESAGTVGIMVEKCTGVEASGSGDDLLQTAFDGTGTAQTLQTGTLTATSAYLTLAVGDRICIDMTDDVPGELVGIAIGFRMVPA